MHVMSPRPTNSALPMFFNVNSSVGNNGTNSNRADILLVQFLTRKISVIAAANLSPDQRARMGRVTVDGVSGPITIDGIRAFQERMRQRHPGTVVDGRASSAQDGHVYGNGVWTIVSLNNSLRKRIPSVWPRLQDLPDCPSPLKTEFQKCM